MEIFKKLKEYSKNINELYKERYDFFNNIVKNHIKALLHDLVLANVDVNLTYNNLNLKSPLLFCDISYDNYNFSKNCNCKFNPFSISFKFFIGDCENQNNCINVFKLNCEDLELLKWLKIHKNKMVAEEIFNIYKNAWEVASKLNSEEILSKRLLYIDEINNFVENFIQNLKPGDNLSDFFPKDRIVLPNGVINCNNPYIFDKFLDNNRFSMHYRKPSNKESIDFIPDEIKTITKSINFLKDRIKLELERLFPIYDNPQKLIKKECNYLLCIDF